MRARSLLAVVRPSPAARRGHCLSPVRRPSLLPLLDEADVSACQSGPPALLMFLALCCSRWDGLIADLALNILEANNEGFEP
uniref:Uncharacterized protein n=1 Tax=Oryza rufipogon TaxID=4529 RepID=A0A0E0Q190_ORYRU